MVPDASSRASRTREEVREGNVESADHLLDGAAPHHYRTRSSGKQRGTTVKANSTCESAGQPSTEVSARFSLE